MKHERGKLGIRHFDKKAIQDGSRLGNCWWYSAMIFVACRCEDVTTALSAYKNRSPVFE